MKVAIALLVFLPIALSLTMEEKLERQQWDQLTHEERNALMDAANKIKDWLTAHGFAVGSAACSVACASATALETMGLSAPVCVAACGLIGLFG